MDNALKRSNLVQAYILGLITFYEYLDLYKQL